MTILSASQKLRLSLIIKKLDQFAGEYVLVHTGQNFTSSLSQYFFMN